LAQASRGGKRAGGGEVVCGRKRTRPVTSPGAAAISHGPPARRAAARRRWERAFTLAAMFVFREGFFECCNPISGGEPEFLRDDQRISSRAATNLFPSVTGNLNLYFQKWASDRHDHVRGVAFIHHGEMEHCMWYNGLAVRLSHLGCTTYVPDVQGFGQSDGARGYFERFEDLVSDFVEFVRQKWTAILDKHSAKGHPPRPPGLVLIGKGFGALVVLHALMELHPLLCDFGVMPSVVLISPAFQFGSFIGDQSNVSCGLTSGQCARQPSAQCARVPAAAMPSMVAFSQPDDNRPAQKLEHMSRWFPKMIITKPVDADMVCRDPQVVDRMSRDVLCWHEGYRARVLAEIAREQGDIAGNISNHPEVFERVPALILHGGADSLFAVHGSHGIHSTWCDAAQRTGIYPRLKIYDGAYHQLLNEPNKDEVVNDILTFVASKMLH